ncbi:error-prone DNA polymerase [Paraliomyxa miuraensis]|uniref:error-prone DNA polymerase n=1 Tax=Paraliomyxa miuraensis TaxID=376150 RepID=UPI0022594193|nr:error-prone DNA polymerase [Paraliomyxa miuraensis]MCX4242404.1 error-prone DNA polymerase [Paraliomyxa miuraensis]
MYAPLWVKSNFSFLEGSSHPSQLVERAHELHLPALALTDRDGVHGIVRAHVRAKELGLRMIHGAQVTVQDTVDAPPRLVVLLAQDREGYGRLCQLLSKGRARCPKGQSRVLTSELRSVGPGLLALCPDPALLPALREPFADRLYALLTRHRQDDDALRERTLRAAASATSTPVVASTEVLYHHRSRRPLQDIVTCIRHGCTLATAGTRIRGNAEHDLLPVEVMQALYADDPTALARSLEVAQRCTFSLDQIRYRYPGERIPEGHTEADWLRLLALRGAARRYPEGVPASVQDQLERELQLIAELDYGGYFLTMYEIVERCREQGILCQGRGSAANSAVCFCLGITAIDPVKMDLLFERFLSRERAEPPDIDLDIEHQRREEVIQWVYARYGRQHAAMVANVIRYRARSAIRDVGKALGMPATALDRLAKLLYYHGEGHGNGHDDGFGPEVLQHAGLDPLAPAHQHLLHLTAELLDTPRHLSIHPGGFLLGHEPVDTLVPIEPATMEGRTVVQWDKYDVEDLGLFKVDLLGLGALSMVQRALAMLEHHEQAPLSMHQIPTEDPATYDMISRGDTLGVFQIESRAQMAMLPRLRPRTFYDLVIEVAIVRPGPIQGDMVHPYLRRRQGLEPVEYPHPALRRVLEKTNGVPIFQEQVMKLAIAVADYTPGQADELRRDMAAWRSAGRIERHRERLLSRMVANGIEPHFAERVFSQIQGFGEYGFPESHAASFALIAYVTAWLRRHHPAVFAAALLNAQPMGFYSPASIVEDAKRRGVPVRPVSVQHSEWDCTLEPAAADGSDDGHDEPRSRWALRMGLRLVKGLGERERWDLEQQPPPYADLDDFVRRTRLPLRSLQALAEAGALSCFGLDRRDALWAVRGLWGQQGDDLPLSADQAPAQDQPRFAAVHPTEAILWDYRASHHSTRGHPMETIRPGLPAGLPWAEDVAHMRDQQRAEFVGLVICRQRPGTASGVTFLTLEDETGFVNVVVWQRVFSEHAILIKSAAVLGVSGKIQQAEGVVHLVAERLWEPTVRAAAPPTQIRSFH